jgi:zinc transport system ATP-binding protein
MNTPNDPVIELENVTVTLGGRIVLKDITLSVAKGQFLAVLGPNGSGKTTLLRTILGQIQPAAGKVLTFQQAPEQLAGERRRLGYVPQTESTDRNFPIHVKDLVMMGRYGRLGLFRRPGRSDVEAAARAMSQVGIEGLSDRPIGELSGGERQRAYLARALAGEPELLLLDEPTAGVDVAVTEGLYQLLQKLQRELNLTLVMVSHDVGVVSQHVDQIACLNQVLVSHGRPAEVLTPGTIECMYGRHAMIAGHGVTPHIILGESDHEKN